MAHFAELGENNKILRVIVVGNSDCLRDGVEDEATGIAFCENLLGGTWVQTSYNNKIRKHYAGIGYTFDKDKDAFIPKKPYNSWSLDKDCNWKAPVEMPKDDKMYSWDEDNLKWIAELEAENVAEK